MYKFGNQNMLSLNDNANKRSHFTPSYTSASNSFNVPSNNSFNVPSNNGFNVPSNNGFSMFAPKSSTPTNNSFSTFAPKSSTPTSFEPKSSTFINNSFSTFAPKSSTPTSFEPKSSTLINNNFAFAPTSFAPTSFAPTNTFTLDSVNQNSINNNGVVNSTQTSDNTMICYKRVFSFDDVNILPSLTTLKSKNEVSLFTKFTKNILTKIPIIILTDNLSNLIEISTNGGLGLFKSYDFVDQLNYVKRIKKYINPIDQTSITVYSNTTFDELKRIFDDEMVDYIAVVDQENTCLGFIEKRNIETLNGNFYANEIMTSLDSMKFYKKTDCNWLDLLNGQPNQELIDSFNTTNIIPIVCDNKKLQGVMTLNNIIKYYNVRSKCVLDNTGRMLSCISTSIFDNYMERVDILIKAGLDILHFYIDNAYNELVFNIVKEIKQKYKNLIIIVGNVNSVEAFKYICESGVDSICVGNGTELGQFTLLQECFQLSKKYNVSIINNSGVFNENLNLIKCLSVGSKCILFDDYKDKNLYIPDILESIQSGLLYVNCTSIENLHLTDINYTLN